MSGRSIVIRGNSPLRMKVVADRPMSLVVITIVTIAAVFAVGVLGYWMGRWQQGGAFQ